MESSLEVLYDSKASLQKLIANIRANSLFAVTNETSPGRFLELSQPFLYVIH